MPSRSIEVGSNRRGAEPRVKVRPRRGRMPQLVQLGAALVAIVLGITALVGDQGLIAVVQARQESAALREKLKRMKADNDRLEEQVERLRKSDPAAIEEVARRELGWIRRGEKVFIVKDAPSPAKP